MNPSNDNSCNNVSSPHTRNEGLGHKARVVVGLSGGVDSAVSLLLLKRAGYAVEAVFMKNWDEDDGSKWCTAAEDFDDARSICAELEVPLRDVNFAHEYWENVFEHFLAEYRRGRTPNPDVICNQQVKFRAFLDYAIDIGAEKIATGHYARIRQHNDSYQLLKALDESKDQSYFLYLLDQEKLSRSMFPLGELPKTQVRALALESGLGVHGKKDSTGICFIGERPFAEFLTQYINEQPGVIESIEGQQLGQHNGLAFYTIGQRQGLGIGGRASGSGQPWYVVAKDPNRNVLITAQGRDHQALYAKALSTDRAHWISGQAPTLPYQCTARIRYRQQDQTCLIEAADNETLVVRFTEPQWAVSPGQSVVFYDHDVCLGGAIINSAL